MKNVYLEDRSRIFMIILQRVFGEYVIAMTTRFSVSNLDKSLILVMLKYYSLILKDVLDT